MSDGSLYGVCSCFQLLEVDKGEYVLIDERVNQRWVCIVYRSFEMTWMLKQLDDRY